MSTASGSGLGGGVQGGFVMREAGLVQLPNGAQVDLTTAAGVAKAEAALDSAQLQELEGLMRSAGFTRAGDAFVPRDSFEVNSHNKILGPEAGTEQTDLDKEIGGKVFQAAGFPNPYHSNTTEALYKEMMGSPQFKAATSSLQAIINQQLGPTTAASFQQAATGSVPQKGLQDFSDRIKALEAQYPQGNIMEVLFLVFRESVEQTNEDKKYFLIKMQEFNKVAESISDYLSYLVEKSKELSTKEANNKDEADKQDITIQDKSFMTDSVGADGKAISWQVTPGEGRKVKRSGLDSEMKKVESWQESVRNERQMASTSFQNFDQKSNQLYNLLSSVLKSVNEMRGGTVRNMM